MKKRCVLFVLCVIFLIGCSEQNEEQEKPVVEESTQTETAAPTKEEVLAMREKVLDGMTDEEKERLTENIKVANLQMERAYLNDDIFAKLEDKDSLVWNYFDQKGDIQIGWAYDGNKAAIMKEEGITESEFYQKYAKPVMVYNRFDGVNFVELIQDMQKSVHNEQLRADLQQLIDLTNLATETHEMEYANDIYKILHDMDYFLLRYGIEDVGKYTKGGGVVSKYYGMLTAYQNEDNTTGLNTDSVSESAAWQEAYNMYLHEELDLRLEGMEKSIVESSSEYVPLDNFKVNVIDLDGDEIPELIISDEYNSIWVFTFDSSSEKVYCVCEYICRASLFYGDASFTCGESPTGGMHYYQEYDMKDGKFVAGSTCSSDQCDPSTGAWLDAPVLTASDYGKGLDAETYELAKQEMNITGEKEVDWWSNATLLAKTIF